MNAEQRALYRTAEAVRKLLMQDVRPVASLPVARWSQLEKLVRQIERCREHDFDRARRCLEATWETRLDELVAALDGQLGQFRPERPKVPSVREIYDDLTGLREEFAEVDADFCEGTIAVTTEPITLGGVFLGPFQIRLAWRDLDEPSPYRVIALEPHPAGTNDGVTHPHVQDEQLCEGEGRQAIEAALAQGRIGDFFLVVAQTLRTYAQGHAYVELSRWRGIVCSDCGAHVDEDERCVCDRCDTELCGGCSSRCHACDRGLCSDCAMSCEACQQPLCEACQTACAGCQRTCCEGCLAEGLCSACQADQEQETDQENESDEASEIPSASAESAASYGRDGNHAAVQPDCLGETALPA